jgi:hypothetical protein
MPVNFFADWYKIYNIGVEYVNKTNIFFNNFIDIVIIILLYIFIYWRTLSSLLWNWKM